MRVVLILLLCDGVEDGGARGTDDLKCELRTSRELRSRSYGGVVDRRRGLRFENTCRR